MGRREDKPDITPEVQEYWRLQIALNKERKQQEERELRKLDLILAARQNKDDNLDFLCASDVAQYLGTRPGTVIKYIKNGTIDGVQPDGFHHRWVVTSQALADFENRARKLEKRTRRYWPRVVHDAVNWSEKSR
jgi:hypothetical protein